ncbi:RNases MRP/P 32.9 kDa subunit-like protein [Elsinoe fawcettii]|nr:RNases MRP/P 32.9 kDa subunit-like protein [Elsinoe fawcettii]
MSEHPALSLLLSAHPPEKAQEIFTTQIQHRPLLLRPSSPDPFSAQTKRDKRRLARQRQQRDAHRAFKATHKSGRASLSTRPRPLSAKNKRRLGIYEIPTEQRKWSPYEGLHRLWCEYIRDVLQISPDRTRKLAPDFAGPMISSADFHGAVVRVVRSGCVGRVGVRGIVVKDTKFTFEVVTRKDELKVLPKEGTVFELEVPREGDALEERKVGEERYVFEIHGGQMMTSAPDRANKKFKMHVDPGL